MRNKSVITNINELGATISEDITNELISEGKSFSYIDYINVPGSTTIYIIFDTSSFSKERIFFIPILFNALGGPFLSDIYENPTFSGGTPLNVVNRNLNGPEAENLLLSGATVTNEGTKLFGYLVNSSVSIGNTQQGGSGGGSLFFEINKNKYYMAKIENTDTNAATIGIDLTWFEIWV